MNLLLRKYPPTSWEEIHTSKQWFVFDAADTALNQSFVMSYWKTQNLP
jgi:hypothetical protein